MADLGKYNSEAQATDAFVKKNQMERSKYAGQLPKLEADQMRFNQNMMNTGEKAKSFARSLTSGMDKVAYPVK